MKAHFTRYLGAIAGAAAIFAVPMTVTAQAKPFEWIARTSQAEPNFGLDNQALLQPRGAGLRQIAIDKDIIKVSELSSGQWVTVHATSHGLKGRQYPRVAQSLDERTTYIWSYDGPLRVSQMAEKGSPEPLFKVEDERLRRLMSSQGGGSLHGDATHGFWVANDYEGGALFIEPGTWMVRDVPGISLPTPMGAGRKPLFNSFALGIDGSIWVIESGSNDVVRRDASGQELVRVRLPFNEAVPAGTTTYGGGALQFSKAGVVIISPTRLEVALINNLGMTVWRLPVCPTGISANCGRNAQEESRLSVVRRAVADGSGRAWITDDTRSVFFYKGTGVPERRYGSTAPCIQQQASVPCVGSQERIMQLSDGRYLIYNMVNGLSLRNLMTIKSGPPAQITFSPITTVVADLPIADRQALLYSLADQRLWGFVAKPLGHSPKYESVEMGVPTNRGLATASLMMLKHLDNPGVIRTPAETQLAKLFELPPFFAPGSHSMARSGPDAVVVKDRRVPPTLLAHYDMRTGDLRQGIEVTGLPPATSCAEDTAREYVFNDNRDTVYLMREWSGEVFVLDSSFTAKRLASLPQADVNGGTGCKRGSNDGFRVPLAARTPSGHLVMATPAGVYIQRGESFDRLAAPDAVVQLLVLNDTEALVVAKSGLAKLSWPR